MPASAKSPIPMRALLAGARRKQRALLELTRAAGSRRIALRLESRRGRMHRPGRRARQKHLGGRVKLHRQPRLRQRSRSALRTAQIRRSLAKPILLLGHLDTVWPLGTLKTMPCRVRDGRLWGPGTLDMKAGVAMAFTAHRDAHGSQACSQREIVLLLNSDEEIGSPVSRPITEELAAKCAAVYVLEPAQGLAYKTARKGTGNWRIDVKGVAAHAGVDFEKGASAIRELARVVRDGERLDRSEARPHRERGRGRRRHKKQRDSRRSLGRGGRAHCPPRRWPAHRAQVCRAAEPKIQRCTLDRNRRHQSSAHGAQPRHRAALSQGAGTRRGTRLCAR